MKILKLELTHFGKFHNKTIPFRNGINVIYGKNEAGKTTIHSFIRAMFFGLSDSGKDRYRPWKDEGGFSGKLFLEKDGLTYRIERDFEEGTLHLFNETDSSPMESSQEKLDELLYPLTEDSFDNILHIGQMQDRFFLKFTANYRKEQEQLDTSLQEVREALLSQEKELEECKEDVAGTAEQLRELEAEKKRHSEAWESSYALYEKTLKEKEQKVQNLFQELATASGGKQVSQGSYSLSILFLLFAAICLVMYFYCTELNLKDYAPFTLYGTIGFTVLAVIVFVVQLILNHRKKRIIALQKQAEEANEDLENFISTKPVPDAAFQAECIEKRHELENFILQVKEHLVEVQDCMRENMTLYHNLQQNRKTNRFPQLYQQASLFFSQISGDTYRTIRLEQDGSLTLLGEGTQVPLRQASRGTADQVYFCLRLAAADLLSKEEKYPIFLDDVFAFYDDDRLNSMLNLLKTRSNQIILFTCHKRESSLLTP